MAAWQQPPRTPPPRGPLRLFLEVDAAAPLWLALNKSGDDAVFVATRWPLQLGEPLTLGVRLRGLSRTLELPVVVVGRSAPGAHGLLSRGVTVALADRDHPIAVVLGELAAGRVDDVERRVEAAARVCVVARFNDLDEARAAMAKALHDGGHFAVERGLRGDRLALTVAVDGFGDLVTVDMVVNAVVHTDGARACVCTALDDTARAALRAALRNSAEGPSVDARPVGAFVASGSRMR